MRAPAKDVKETKQTMLNFWPIHAYLLRANLAIDSIFLAWLTQLECKIACRRTEGNLEGMRLRITIKPMVQ